MPRTAQAAYCGAGFISHRGGRVTAMTLLSGLCVCGHRKLAHEMRVGTPGPCQHALCLRAKEKGCPGFRPVPLSVLPEPLFTKGRQGGYAYIQCGICTARSFNQHDIDNEYCSNCHVFYSDLILEFSHER